MSNKSLVLQIANKEFELATKSLHEALGVIVQSKLDEKKKMIAASTFCEAKKPMSAKDAAEEAEKLVTKRAGEYVKRKHALDKDLEDRRNKDTSYGRAFDDTTPSGGPSFDAWKERRAANRKKLGLDENQLQEVSKILTRYIDKAIDDVNTRSRKTVVGGTPEQKKAFYDKENKKIDDRLINIDKAISKIKKKN